jgi:hypothetical protein
MRDRARSRPLEEIVGSLHPWLRSRICSILICPVKGGGWEAVLTYVPKTHPPPPDLQLAPAAATDLIDTHHALDLPRVGIEAALREQLRELAGMGELGTLQVEKIPGVNTTSVSPGTLRTEPHLSQPAWLVKTHAGLLHQRRMWLSRIGRPDFGR